MDVEWLIRKFCFDDDFEHAEIDADFHHDDVWARLIRSLPRRKNLQHLKISRSSEYPIRSDEDLEDLFRAISNVPQLNKLELLEFSASDLTTGQDIFSNFLALDLLDIELSDDSSAIPADLGRSIASIPHLSKITIITPCSFAMSNLFAPKIESFLVECLSKVTFEYDHFRLLVDDLAMNRFKRLSSLDIHGVTIDNSQIPLLAMMLKENVTIVELRLSLWIRTDADQCCEEIIDAMSHNSVLQTFLNFDALSLERALSLATKESQNKMISRNTTLLEFDLFYSPSFNDVRREKDMYLMLNAAGRKRLMGGGSESIIDWLNVLCDEDVREDLSCLFFLLRMNPSFCLTYQELKQNDPKEDGRKPDENEETRPKKKSCT
ncbi:MAG: hypothetical protein SGBAC_009134 [Bacillariaceae sp.]